MLRSRRELEAAKMDEFGCFGVVNGSVLLAIMDRRQGMGICNVRPSNHLTIQRPTATANDPHNSGGTRPVVEGLDLVLS